jgi:DNA-binding HxlR family transcriptional regulator
VTRKLRLLRAHGLIQKVSKTHRYVVTDQGRKVITTVLAARDANADWLTTHAA